ncbi:MAG: flagellar hook-associated protein FlgL [Liquorilactobacillus hordei]|uniref:Flagellar hook-associated protein 3 n=1 Tax=Liquorilactobacillus hordei TaxID=468911 RepID=A0A3S6QWM9_9LACO|nr:flagellar hook-associated protein FlgL [Liquorilactobacillus hordei]AUJ30635.1 flagellar hook-associated protein 3 [Liquorilactobacillus hordei]
MRISSSMVYSDFLSNLSVNSNKVQKTMSQLSSSKQVNKSSDDPLAASQIMNLKDLISQNESDATTISDSLTWTKTQDSALSDINTAMLRIKTLIQSSANGTSGTDEFKANKNEIQQNIESIVDSLNTNYGGKYVFAGQNTTTQPFSVEKDDNGDITGIKYSGTADNLSREVSKGTTVNLVTDGSQFLDESGTTSNPQNLGTFFNDLVTALNNGDTNSLSGDIMSKFEDYRQNFVNVRSKMGSLENRLTSVQSRNETENTNLTDSLSDKQDVDVASKYIEYTNQMATYQATMAMGTKVMQTSVMDYMK